MQELRQPLQMMDGVDGVDEVGASEDDWSKIASQRTAAELLVDSVKIALKIGDREVMTGDTTSEAALF
jgi:hypothetical protein